METLLLNTLLWSGCSHSFKIKCTIPKLSAIPNLSYPAIINRKVSKTAKVKSEICQRTFIYWFSFLTPSVWDSLPSDLRNLPTLPHFNFKSQLKSRLSFSSRLFFVSAHCYFPCSVVSCTVFVEWGGLVHEVCMPVHAYVCVCVWAQFFQSCCWPMLCDCLKYTLVHF